MVQDNSERRSHAAASARRDDLRQRLVAAAEAAVAQHGLESLKARTLATAAGCSVGAIYDVFADLDGLVLAVNGRTLDAIDTALRERGDGAGAAPAERLVRLAAAYLGYAARHRRRWDALFLHRMPEGRPVEAWYAVRQTAAFSHVEAPLGDLLPGLDGAARALLARSLFSAVHGMVALGLDEKVAAMPLEVLREQVATVVRAVAAGLTSSPLPLWEGLREEGNTTETAPCGHPSPDPSHKGRGEG